MHRKLNPDPFLILVNSPQNSHCMQGILLQIRCFERELSNSFKKDNYIFLSNRMSPVCHLHVIHMSLVCTRMSLVCTRMSSVCHCYVLVCHPYVNRMSPVCHSYVIRMSLVCHSYVTRMYSHVIRMSLVYTHMWFICHSCVLVCHSYVTRMYSYVIRMSLVCTRMSSLCHSYVLACHSYVTRMYSHVTRMSLVCTRMSFVCHWYVVLPRKLINLKLIKKYILLKITPMAKSCFCAKKM